MPIPILPQACFLCTLNWVWSMQTRPIFMRIKGNTMSFKCFGRRLMRSVLLVGQALVLASATSLAASDQDDELFLTITAGSQNGTYYRFAQEIAEMLPGVRFEIVTSEGSVQNLRRLIGYEGQAEQQFFQLALVQADVLDQLRSRAAGNGVLESIVDRIKVVMPLYGEEIHIYAERNRELNTIEDIITQDVIVNAGGEKSGTNLTARWLFEQLGYADATQDWTNFSTEAGLPAMGAGYDILFDVSGAPSSTGSSIQESQELKLIPITEYGTLLDSQESPYRTAVLTPKQYPWLTRDVPTLAVSALLVTFDYDENNPYCDLIERLTRAIADGLAARQDPTTNSHPKWREVDLVNAGNRRDVYKCAQRALNGR
ncbi:TAXI family TRAP transporter solute-binding subunit [uncultured Roseobacter sp.]|uniref:TAXI family TRAP transporter solute-binding subunit n=1 Tax=uncultured Roseobacter sp. TaxID=114847 RepID=UPI002624FC1D|nr:TAXI family TRAP transporter solute-binding subunit [uncultured Roseobacter sp.]